MRLHAPRRAVLGRNHSDALVDAVTDADHVVRLVDGRKHRQQAVGPALDRLDQLLARADLLRQGLVRGAGGLGDDQRIPGRLQRPLEPAPRGGGILVARLDVLRQRAPDRVLLVR